MCVLYTWCCGVTGTLCYNSVVDELIEAAIEDIIGLLNLLVLNNTQQINLDTLKHHCPWMQFIIGSGVYRTDLQCLSFALFSSSDVFCALPVDRS